jgi:hypothetical protein
VRQRRLRCAGAMTAATLLFAIACSSGTSTTSPTSTATAGGSSTTTAAGKGSAKGDTPTGPVTAGPSQLTGDLAVTNGFKPEENGFPFQNYGKVDGRPNLTADEMRRFFGDKVCASLADGKCTLTPPAEQWMEKVSNGMNGGHCEGMAALSLLLYLGKIQLSDIVPGSSKAIDAKIEGNDKLAREIAFWFATQNVNPTQASEDKTMKPGQIVDLLKESFKPGAAESYTIGIYKTVDGQRTAGHAITPYGIVEKGDGKFQIAVYDNNFPGQARAVEVDTNGDQKWTYSAAADPKEPESLYEGSGTTGSLTLTPTSARLKEQGCPFCEGSPSAASSFGRGAAQQADAGEGLLFLNEEAGDKGVKVKVTGLDGNPLPGITFITPKNGDGTKEITPIIQIPAGSAFRVTIDGSAITEAVQTDVTFIGPGFDEYIDDVNLDPGQVDTADFNPAEGSLAYETKGAEAPNIGFGFSSPDDDFDFSVGGVDLPNGGRIEAKLDQKTGKFTVRNAAADKGTYAVTMDRIDANDGEATFFNDGVELAGGATIVVDYSLWDSKTDKLKVHVDLGDGSAPTDLELDQEKQ